MKLLSLFLNKIIVRNSKGCVQYFKAAIWVLNSRITDSRLDEFKKIFTVDDNHKYKDRRYNDRQNRCAVAREMFAK